MTSQHFDIAIVGAGAAGLATAAFAAARLPGRTIAALDGATKLGAKILVSGGGRCNVTNTVVTERDFWGGSRNIIRNVLSAFPAERAAQYFRDTGVALHEEEGGKLFPNSNSAHSVLDALVKDATARGVQILTGCRVQGVGRTKESFELSTSTGTYTASAVVLATGGLSLPKTGSDGGGYQLAQSLGHTLVRTTAALAPLMLDGPFHAPLSGISHDAEITIHVEGAKPTKISGSLLWTHFGISGPAALDASRHWLRATLEERPVTASLSFLPELDLESADRRLQEITKEQSRIRVTKALAELLPARIAEALVRACGMKAEARMAHLRKDERRTLLRALLEWPLPILKSRGYNFAEVTAGGVPLEEINPATMESRRCPGLFLVGEILDVDGRIGGFNFQWSWSSAHVAAAGLIRRLDS